MALGKALFPVLLVLSSLIPGAAAQGGPDVDEGVVDNTVAVVLCVVSHPPYIQTYCSGGDPAPPPLDVEEILERLGINDAPMDTPNFVQAIIASLPDPGAILVEASVWVDFARHIVETVESRVMEIYHSVPSTYELLRMVEESGLEESANGVVCTVWRQVPSAACQ